MYDETVKRKEKIKEQDLNLSDFALFLAVMKNKEAHESTLRIIMEKPELQLEEVRVEEVVLNALGKRAIRLDAWAKDSDGVQYNTEMQNDTENDDVRKRSRYYQGLMDTPILKSGKTTKYKELPATVIIFITQEDIFGKDLAKYTFTAQCEEIAGFHLDDGITKIFLNMSSKNGTPELVSLLQYMKNTRLDNPEVVVKDERLRKIDAVVNEVKESEEWEAARMSIYSVAWNAGIEAGRKAGEEIGRKAGEEIGRKAGEEMGRRAGEEMGRRAGRESLWVEFVCKKLRKGKNVEKIAEELEEDENVIRQICEIARPFAPEYPSNDIAALWMEKRKEVLV